jgi:hypothetical protein
MAAELSPLQEGCIFLNVRGSDNDSENKDILDTQCTEAGAEEPIRNFKLGSQTPPAQHVVSHEGSTVYSSHYVCHDSSSGSLVHLY